MELRRSLKTFRNLHQILFACDAFMVLEYMHTSFTTHVPTWAAVSNKKVQSCTARPSAML